MAAYATVEDVQARMSHQMDAAQTAVCQSMLEDAGVVIDAFNSEASVDVKKVVTCKMIVRSIGDGGSSGVPVGATQGSMAGLGYSQSWTFGSGSVGELYLSKIEKQLLGVGNKIGSRSPLENLVPEAEE